MNVTYQSEPHLLPHDFVDLLWRSTLAERRPVHEEDTVRAMLKNADVIITARLGERLIGVSRAIISLSSVPRDKSLELLGAGHGASTAGQGGRALTSF